MVLDMAMGGSTNTVLHMLAIAHEAGVAYDMERINELSQQTPNVCKVAPSSHYHVEDVHNAGGIHTILGSVARGRPGLLNLDCPTVTGKTLGENIAEYDLRGEDVSRRKRWSWPPSRPPACGTSEGMSVAAPGRLDPRPDARPTSASTRPTASARSKTPTARRAGW